MAFSLNETTLLSAINSGNIFSIINSTLSPGYGIYLKSGLRALSPSSFLGIEYGADASVVSAPIEQGSYSSFNKVKRPPINVDIFSITISRDGTTYQTSASFGIDEVPTLDASNISVTLA